MSIEIPCEKTVIQEFVNARRTGLTIDRWPDEEERNVPEIDALVGPFAIEHTTIDTVPGMRLQDARFEKFANFVRNKMTFKSTKKQIQVAVSYAEIEAVRDLKSLASTLAETLDERLPELSERAIIEEIGSDRVTVTVDAWESSRPGVWFSRKINREELGVSDLEDQLCRKISKLSKYADEYTTVLLIEFQDLALMNPPKATDMIRSALGRHVPTGVKEVWHQPQRVSATGDVICMELS